MIVLMMHRVQGKLIKLSPLCILIFIMTGSACCATQGEMGINSVVIMQIFNLDKSFLR